MYIFGSKKEKNRNRDSSIVKNPSRKKRKKKEEKVYCVCGSVLMHRHDVSVKQDDSNERKCDCKIDAV